MADEPQVFTTSELVDVLVDATRGSDAGRAVESLTALVTQVGTHLSDGEVVEIARVDRYSDPAIDLTSLRLAVESEMKRRGIWRRFRQQERLRVWGTGLRWTAGILLLSVGVLAAVFGGIVGLKWLLYWMGF